MFAGTTSTRMTHDTARGLAVALGSMLLLGTTAAAQGSSPAPSTAGPIVVAAVEPETPLTSLWNGDIGDAASTWTPRIDGNGRIWTSPVNSNAFRIFGPDGTVEQWGTAGSGDGELRSGGGPHALGIAFAPDGGFYVADAGNRRIQRFDKDRQYVRSFGSFGTADDQFVSPIELALDGAENVYVFDDELGTIKEFTADGGFVRSVACGGPFLGVTHDGTVLAFDNASGDGVLNRCAPDGSVVPWLDLSSMVGFGTGIVVDQDGSLWIASTTSGDDREQPQGLLHLDADGKVLARWEVAAEGFDVDPSSGRLYTAYYRQPSLGAYELTGE